MRRPRPALHLDDRGLGGAEVLPLAVALFAASTLAVSTLWGVIDGRAAASAAATEAIRAYVSAPEAAAAEHAANHAAASVMASQGRDPDRLELSMQLTEGQWGRCASVRAVATYPVRALGATITVRAEHAGVVDPWRDGLEGEGCR